MENCIYQGKVLCTYDLKDVNNLYFEDLVLEWKEAAAARYLHCVECGAPVYLAAGPIKEPYFAHYDSEECDYGRGQESEELKIGKRLLYQLLKRSFPESDIVARYRMDNGMYCTLFCKTEQQSIVVDYRLVNNSLEKFRLRDDYFHRNQLQPVYVLGKRQEKNTKQLDWYQNLLQNSMGYLAFLDTSKEELTLKRSYSFRLGRERQFRYCCRSYPIREVMMDEKGAFTCDFPELCNKLEQQIAKEKRKYQRTLDTLKQLREDRLRPEEEEQRRMEDYRRNQEEGQPFPRSIPVRRGEEEILELGLSPTIYEKCIRMIEQGEGHLVAKKYYDIIMDIR